MHWKWFYCFFFFSSLNSIWIFQRILSGLVQESLILLKSVTLYWLASQLWQGCLECLAKSKKKLSRKISFSFWIFPRLYKHVPTISQRFVLLSNKSCICSVSADIIYLSIGQFLWSSGIEDLKEVAGRSLICWKILWPGLGQMKHVMTWQMNEWTKVTNIHSVLRPLMQIRKY